MNPLPYNKHHKNKPLSFMKWVMQLLAAGVILVLTGCTPPGVNALLEGKDHLDKGEIKEAITAFKKATNFMPNSARAYNYLGLAYHRDGQFIAARDAYDKSYTQDNNLAQARFNKGCLLLETGQYGLAITCFKTFQMLSPKSTEVLPLLALAYYGDGELETAKSIYEDLLRINEKIPSAWNGIGLILVQQGDIREAYNYFSTALKHQSKYTPALFNQGVIAYPSLNRPDLAVKKLREFTFHAPEGPLVSRAKSMAASLEKRLLSKAKPEPTEVAVTQQENNLPKKDDSQNSDVGTIAPPEETESEKTKQTEVVLNTENGSADNQTNQTENLESQGSSPTQDSIELDKNQQTLTVQEPETTTEKDEVKTPPIVTQALENPPSTNQTNFVVNQSFITDPNDASTEMNETEIQPIIINEEPVSEERNTPALVRSTQPGVTPLPQREADNHYKYLLPGAPIPGDRYQASVWSEKGSRAFQRKDFAEAVDAFEKAVIEDPSYFEAYCNLGLAALMGGNPRKALPAYEFALAIKPNDRDSRYNLSLGLEKLNHFRDAARELESLLKENPADTQVLMRLGNLYSGPLQRPVRTREIYRELLKVSPGSLESRAAQRWLYENP